MENEVVFDLAWVAGLVGFFLPLLISLVKKNEWSRMVKQAVALVASIVAALVTVGLQVGADINDLGNFLQLAIFSIVDVFVVASVTYSHFFEDTEVETSLANLGSSHNKTARHTT